MILDTETLASAKITLATSMLLEHGIHAHRLQHGNEEVRAIVAVTEHDIATGKTVQNSAQQWAGEIPLKLSLSIDPAFVPIFDWTKMQYSVLIEEIDLVYL